MNFINIEQNYNLSNPNQSDDFQIGINKFDPELDQVAIKKIKYKKDLQKVLGKIPLILESSRRCGLVPPLGYYQNVDSKNKEIYMIYKKYSGSYADLKAKKIQNGESFSKEEMQSVINCILHCLSNLQKNSIYHGNIKLTNLLYLEGSSSVHLSEAGYPSQKEKNKEWFLTPEEIPGHECYSEDPDDLEHQLIDTFQFGMVLVELLTLRPRKDLECLKYDYGEKGIEREQMFKEISTIISPQFLELLRQLLVVPPNDRKQINKFDSSFFEIVQQIESGPQLGTLPRFTNADIDEYNDQPKTQEQYQPKIVSSLHSLDDIDNMDENKPTKQEQNILNVNNTNQNNQQEIQNGKTNRQNVQSYPQNGNNNSQNTVYDQDEDTIRKENENFKAQNVIKMVDSENMGQAGQKSFNGSNHTNQNFIESQVIINPLIMSSVETKKPNLLESEIIKQGNSQIYKSPFIDTNFIKNPQSGNQEQQQQNYKQKELNLQEYQQNQQVQQQLFVFSPKKDNQFIEQLDQQDQEIKSYNTQNWMNTESPGQYSNGNFLNPNYKQENTYQTQSKQKSVGFVEDSYQQGSQQRLVSQQSDLNFSQQYKQNINNNDSDEFGKPIQFSMNDIYSSASQQNQKLDMKQVISLLQKCIEIKQLDILDVFVYYDQDYDYTLDDPITLNKIFTILGLLHDNISEEQSFQIFQQYSFQPQKMSFLGLLQQLVSQKQLFVSLLINMLKLNKWNILQLFEKYQSQESSCWGLKELMRINDENKFRFDENTLKSILNELLDQVDSQDKTLNSKELAQILGFRIQTPNEMIIRSINQRMHSQIKRLTEIQYQELMQKQREQELERQLKIEKQKREKILQQVKEREEKENNYRLKQEKMQKEQNEYIESKKHLPSLGTDNQIGFQVNKQMFWKTLGSTVAQIGFDPILSKRQDNLISAKQFYKALVEDYEFTDCLELREFVDSLAPNKHINISKLREKLRLPTDIIIPDTKDEELVLPDDMIEEIKDLFVIADKDNSGNIEKHEIENLLKLLGINAKDEELDQFFKKYDKDGDKTISFREYQIIMTQQIYNQMLCVSDIIDDLKTQFKRIDINNKGSLNSYQLNHVLSSLGINLKEEELQSIFTEIDQDKSGSVELNEFLNFIKRDCKKLSGLQASTVIKVRSCRKPRISELQQIFMNFPQNCILSFLYSKQKNGFNLPALGIKPKVNGSTGTIKDLVLINDSNIKSTLLKGKKLPNEILAEISIEQALCIPLPKEKKQLESIKLMEVVVCLYDKQRKKFLGNCCTMQAYPIQSKTQGNCWNFGDRDDQNTIVIRYSNYNEKRDSELVVCFEFVLHYQIGNKLIQISCGFSEINLSDLKENDRKLILINGGDPWKQIPVDWLYTFPEEQMSQIKSLSDIKAEPCVKIIVKSKIQDEDILSLMPGIIIFNKRILHFYKAFREYLADHFSTKFVDSQTLKQDLKIKSFLAIINCPDTSKQVADMWEDNIYYQIDIVNELNIMQTNSHIQNDVHKEITYMDSFLQSMSGMIANKQFGFNSNDPTKCSLNDPELNLYRKNLFDYYINNLLNSLQINVKEQIAFPVGREGGDFQPPEDDEDEEDQLLENDDLVKAKTILLQQKKRVQEDDEYGEEYKESIAGEDYLFLFTTEDITEEVFQKVTLTKILLIDFREQISRGKYSLSEVEQIAKGLKQNKHLKSLYLKLSLSSYDEDIEKIKLSPLLTTLSTAELKLKSLYLHLDYNDLSIENASYKLTNFLKSQRVSLQNLNLNLESTNLTFAMGKDLALGISQLTSLQNLNLNVSLNQLGPNFVECLADALKKLKNITCLKLDLEKIEMKEFCLSCYCGYYMRICLQFIPIFGSCCMWVMNFYTALEHIADAISKMDKLQYLNLNVAQNNLGDRLLRHFEYKFGKALYTRPNLTTLILNFKRNKFETKSIKSISTLGISSLKVDLRYNFITEEGLSKIPPALYSLRNLKSLSFQMEGNKNKGSIRLANQQSSSRISTENIKPSQPKSGQNSEMNSLQNSRLVNGNNSNLMPNLNNNSQIQVLNNIIDYDSQKYYENKILKSITNMPQIEHIEISGLGGIHGKSNQNSIISNKFPAIKQMYLRAKRKNMFKFQLDAVNNQNYSIPNKHIFNEEDDIDTVISLFCNSQTLEEIHLQFLYDSQVLKTSLNLKYFNPLTVIDFSDCVQIEEQDIFKDFINLINRNQSSLERLYIGGIQLLEQQLSTLSLTLHKVVRDRGKPLSYLEYSHFDLYNGDNTSKASFSCCDRMMLFIKEYFGTCCDFKEEVFQAQEEKNLIQIQNYIPEIGQITQILTIRNLITLSYFKDQRYLEIKNFDQENVMEFRLFELLQGLLFNDVKTIVVRDQLIKENAQIQHLNQINYLNDEQFSSFMRCDLKRNFPLLENLEVVFAPSPNELSNCLKSLSIKLLQNERKYLKEKIIISHQQQKNYEEEVDKDPIEKELMKNKGLYLFFYIISLTILVVASVLIPFIFTKVCGEGHDYASHIIFAGVSILGLFIESYFIKYWIIPNQRPKLLSGRDKSWRRRLTEHFKNKGDLYILLLISLISKFDLYSNFLFISITNSCGYMNLFIIGLCFLGVNVLCNFSSVWYLIKYVYSYKDQPQIPYLFADVFSQLTNFLNMCGISYLMEFKEVKVAMLFFKCWMVPINMSFTLLKLIFDNFPMIVLKIIFLIDKKVDTRLEETSVILSAISSVLNAIIFGLIFIKKFEELRYTLESKGSFGFIKYERKDLEEFLGKPLLQSKQGDVENKEQLDKSIIEEDEQPIQDQQKGENSQINKIDKKENEKKEQDAEANNDNDNDKDKDKQEEERKSEKSISSQNQNQEDQPLQQQEGQAGDKKVDQNQQKDKQLMPNANLPARQQPQKANNDDNSCCCCNITSCFSSCCSCGSCTSCCSCNCITSISNFFSKLFTFTIKDFSFFYEKSIQDLDISIRFRMSLYKFFFWIASIAFYCLTYILPFHFYESCDRGVSHTIFYIFIGVCFFLTIIEYKLIYPLVKSMYEIPRSKYNEFPMSWMFKLFLSMILKANFMTDLVVLIYGRNCYEKKLVFDLIFISVTIVFWLRGFKQLRYLLKPLQTDTLFPVITRFTILADLTNMMLLPKLVYPYLPERRITRLRIPDNLMLGYLRFVLEDVLMIILNICYLVFILTDGKENGNIFEFVIVSLSLSVISAVLTIKWWGWPLKMNKQEDLDRLFLRNDEIIKQTQLNEFEYAKTMRHSREFCCCLISRNGCVSQCLGLD